ncbi:MAG: hypothetical protein JWR04_374 [Rhodoglobus sp.]|nr:hypothetical protein [Rhodoglobus sp.]
MNCPIDATPLVMSERSGIEIDYCPQCRGVWLDRGELDKIVERSLGAPAPAAGQQPQPRGVPLVGRNDQYGGTNQYGQRRKKESWLSELFD